jgi:hypothetical protein
MHPALPPASPPEDAVECVVFDLPVRRSGFYTHGFRTFYVATDSAVYLVRAPGQRATLQQVDDLPGDSHADDIVIDTVLHYLAAAAEAAGRRPPSRDGLARHSQGAP